MVTDAKKLQLIKRIAETDDQALIDQIARMINTTGQEPAMLNKLNKPIEKNFDLEKIKREQNFRPIERTELDRLIQEADIQESIEDLLAALRR